MGSGGGCGCPGGGRGCPGGGFVGSSKRSGKATTETIKKKATARTAQTNKNNANKIKQNNNKTMLSLDSGFLARFLTFFFASDRRLLALVASQPSIWTRFLLFLIMSCYFL